jgi:membrane-associated protease RseP (regulator of RpoE activity)
LIIRALIWISVSNKEDNTTSSDEAKPLTDEEEAKRKKEEEEAAEKRRKQDEEDSKTFSLQIPFILVRTKRGLNLMDRLAASRVIKPFGTISLALFPFVGAIGFTLILLSVSIMFSNASVRQFIRDAGPQVNLLIPGLNPYVPIVYGWIALVIAMVVHEGSHGVIARYFKYRVRSSGLIFLAILPMGAFVDIDEDEIKKAPARNASRVMAGGPMSNFIVGIISLLTLMLLVSSMVPASNGMGIVGIVQNSPAHQAGIQPSDMILAINGTKISSTIDANNTLSKLKPGDQITVEILQNGQQMNKSLVLTNKPNSTAAFIGFEALDSAAIKDTLERYRTPSIMSPLIYFFLPTFSQGQFQVPYSDTMHSFYTSPIGGATYAVANLLFWLWFVNFNLAIFNALPLYPLDGGQAVRSALNSYGAKKGWKQNTAQQISRVITLLLVGLILSVVIGPYLLG